MANINNLFSAEEISAVTIGNRGLEGTAQLTALAAGYCEQVMNTINEDVEYYSSLLEASKSDHDMMDKLIAETIGEALTEAADEAEFMRELSDEHIDSMLKSQQSKRSRCKSKVMTLDNYKSMLTAAIAENIIRTISGKEKSKGGSGRARGSVDYTIEQLEELGNDQEALAREIRNIQSKKSIMKSKVGFSEADDRYQALLRAEATLKDMRTAKGARTVEVEVDRTKDALAIMLSDVEIDKLHAADSKELLAKIAELVFAE